MGTVVSLISAGDEKKYCLFDDFICLMKYDLVSSSDIEECLKIKKKKRELNHQRKSALMKDSLDAGEEQAEH